MRSINNTGVQSTPRKVFCFSFPGKGFSGVSKSAAGGEAIVLFGTFTHRLAEGSNLKYPLDQHGRETA